MGLLLLIFLLVLGYLVFLCFDKREKYMSLPFAGGDVRTFAPDSKRIEGPMYKAMDRIDEDAGWEGSDYPR